MCEYFNATILEAWNKLIITLLKLVKGYIMKRIVLKREVTKKWKHLVGPKIWKLIKSSKSLAVDCISDYYGGMKFEVS